MTQTNTLSIETEIRQAYAVLGHELATISAFSGGSKWDANSQYGYCLSEYDTRAEAERAVIDYYSERMHLIRQ